MATDTRIVKALENLGKELNHINANLQALCSIIKDKGKDYTEYEQTLCKRSIKVNGSNLCENCKNFKLSDAGYCDHGHACLRLAKYFVFDSSGNSSL